MTKKASITNWYLPCSVIPLTSSPDRFPASDIISAKITNLIQIDHFFKLSQTIDPAEKVINEINSRFGITAWAQKLFNKLEIGDQSRDIIPVKIAITIIDITIIVAFAFFIVYFILLMFVFTMTQLYHKIVVLSILWFCMPLFSVFSLCMYNVNTKWDF